MCWVAHCKPVVILQGMSLEVTTACHWQITTGAVGSNVIDDGNLFSKKNNCTNNTVYKTST